MAKVDDAPMFFSPIEDAAVLTSKGNVLQGLPVYEYKGMLFARKGNGYIRLYAKGQTGVNGLTVIEFRLPFPLKSNNIGYAIVPGGEADGDKAVSAL